jgi:hypothetical protein
MFLGSTPGRAALGRPNTERLGEVTLLGFLDPPPDAE